MASPALTFSSLVAVLIVGACFVARVPTPALDVERSVAGYPDLGIPGHSGGFGEPTCRGCHFDNGLNPPGGSLSIEGWPDRVAPDSSYQLVVSVRHEALVRAGFQAAVRFADGSPAGSLAPADDRTFIIHGPEGVAYAQHTLKGTEPVAEREGAWTIVWTAPERTGTIWLHIAANAADGDRSEFGDYIYADSLGARAK